MFCRNCGKQLDDAAKFCPDCGSSTAEQTAQPAAEQPTVTYTESVVFDSSEQKSRLIAGLLGIFLGGWGIHNFYLGYTNKGILNIVLNFLCGIGYILGLIEAIMILVGKTNVDAKNIPLKD